MRSFFRVNFGILTKQHHHLLLCTDFQLGFRRTQGFRKNQPAVPAVASKNKNTMAKSINQTIL